MWKQGLKIWGLKMQNLKKKESSLESEAQIYKA